VNDYPRNTKSMDDMVFNEVNNITCFNFSERYNFCPLQKVIGYSKDQEPLMED